MDQTQRGFALEDKTEEEQLALALEASRATFKREASKFHAQYLIYANQARFAKNHYFKELIDKLASNF